MTYVRHCTQPSLAGLLTQTARVPALTCRAIFTRPFFTPAHEARAGGPFSGLPLYNYAYLDLTVVVSLRSGRLKPIPLCHAFGALSSDSAEERVRSPAAAISIQHSAFSQCRGKILRQVLKISCVFSEIDQYGKKQQNR